MSEKSFPERLFEVCGAELVSVAPPHAQLAPSSKIPQRMLGKIPSRRQPSGLYAGYDWRKIDATAADVRQWFIDGANVGVRATYWPGVDIDCTDPQLAQMIEDAVVGQLGPAPVRVGRAPKRLLMYRTTEPFSRMRLWIEKLNDEKHLVEILGEGQQYLIHGVHPSGSVYQWSQDPTQVEIVEITADRARACLDHIQQLVEMLDIGVVKREGDGHRVTRTAASDQSSLLAPSVEAVRTAVATIPNNDEIFPTRAHYLKMGYAIRAAVGAKDDEEGFEIFAEWAARWDGGSNDPDVVRDDYRRFTPPYSVGWSFIAGLARSYGYNDVAEEFDVTAEAPDAQVPATESAPMFSDQWLAETLIERNRGVLRFVPQKGTWLVWDDARWAVDAELQGESIILQGLKEISLKLLREGASEIERAKNYRTALSICSADKASSVAKVVRASRAIAISMDALDHDPWKLNTPGGLVDLKTGTLTPPDPDALATRITAVPPDFGSGAPEWTRFLDEATGRDRALVGFLQRYAGYCLTGSTKEEQLLFVFGPGGNGKSLFLSVLTGILGDYAVSATMDTFTASNSEKHTTDLAMLVGARLVAASETSAGKRLDDQRIKAMTGSDKITARFMRQDNFTYQPQFKLLFVGNHQPELRDVDKAMRRRIHMVPFTVTPARVDKDLRVKLQREWPAILAWMIQGCLDWQEHGLQPPQIVQSATSEYFEREDAYGAWIEECVAIDPEATISTQELFQSWLEWANPRNEQPGTQKRLASALISRGWARWRDPKTRRMGFVGFRVIKGQDLSMF